MGVLSLLSVALCLVDSARGFAPANTRSSLSSIDVNYGRKHGCRSPFFMSAVAEPDVQTSEGTVVNNIRYAFLFHCNVC
jgi:hypothetical protein